MHKFCIQKHFKFLNLLLIFTFLCNLTLFGCTTPTPQKYSKSEFYFDTIISITLYSNTNCEDIFDYCFAICEKYENMFSKTIQTSDISLINASNGEPITVSDETIYLLKKSLQYCELSNGAYDITIANVSSLWNFKSLDAPTIPSKEDIDNALKNVNYKNISIDNKQVTLLNPNSSIDLGSIAKGYIADKLKEYLSTQENITGGIISLGGNIVSFGSKPDNSLWNIAIQKPFEDQNTPIGSINAANISVVSSGTYERYFEINNTIYHHILDTSTGYPINNNLYQVTIITPSSTEADALSTTCFALGIEEGLKLVESLENTEAIFIDKNYNITKSSGVDSLYKFKLCE